MIELLPLEIILEISSYLRDWKDLLSLRDVKNKRIAKIIITRREKLFEERRISNDFVQYDFDNQINKKGDIVKISGDLPFEQLPWKYQTAEKCKEAVQKKYEMYYYIKDKTNEIRLLAANHYALQYNFPFWNFREVLDATFIENFGCAIKYLEHQTPDLCLLAVKHDGYALKHISEQTEELCVAAVKQNGLALQYVKKQTEKLCFLAVEQNGCALKYVRIEQTEEICFLAVEQDGHALEYVRIEQTRELCIKAIEQNCFALQHVKEQTEEMCIMAVKKCGLAVQYASKQTEKLCSLAFARYWGALQYICTEQNRNRLVKHTLHM